MKELDFDGLNARLLACIRDLLPRWLPGGRLIGHEWSCGSLLGEQGDSLKVNINTGKWADFAGTDKGGDLVSLFAAINKVSQGDAFRQLADGHAPAQPEVALVPPPAGTPAPGMVHPRYGSPALSWCYRAEDGSPMFYVARYDTADGKQIVPWSWLSTGKWTAKGWQAPRPLYGLDRLAARPTAPVLIVEGEKAADAAHELAGSHYVVVTWPNGGKAVSKADWTSLYGRRLLIWPDADVPGRQAAAQIGEVLLPYAAEVKVIHPDAGPDNAPPAGWDAADALAEGWTWERFLAWAKPIAQIITMPPPREPETLRVDAPDGTRIGIQVNTEERNAQLTESQWALMERLGIACAGNGTPICNITNARRVIDGIPEFKGLVWFDEFHKRYFTRWVPGQAEPGPIREWSDIDDLRLTSDMHASIGLHRMSDETVAKAVRMYAHDHITNEPRDWMDTLAWDKEDRVADFLTACMGVEPSEYARAASRNFWIGMVARIYKPGCQLDNMLVLEGAQGIGKTRALRLIGGDWYTSAKESVSRNDFFMTLAGKLLVEIAELDSFSRAEVTRIKQVVSDPVDRYRSPYDRRAQDHQRMSIFVGTTNEEAYLRDATGGRRFWPVKCGEVAYDLIAKNRTQFFAEAVYRLKQGETWYTMPEAQTREAQESRRQTDEWEHIINSFLNAPTLAIRDQITVVEIASDCLRIEPSKLDKPTQMRISHTLKALGWVKKQTYAKGDGRQRSWCRPATSMLSEVEGG